MGLVLLIACANIANLLLAKGAARQHEIAVRGALGAGRWAIFTQLLAESGLLALAGGLLGLALGFGLLRILIAVAPDGVLPPTSDLHLNLPILGTALAASTLAGLFFGSTPAWYASRIDPGQVLKGGGLWSTGQGSRRLRRGLVIGEFALALALMSAAGLTMHSFWNLNRIDLGIHTDHVLALSLRQPTGRFKEAAQIGVYYQQILSALATVTGVAEVAVDTGVPLRYNSDGMPFTIVGGPTYIDLSRRPSTGFQSVSPGYFKTFGIPVLKGRSFDEQDTASSVRVAMVNEEFVARFFSKTDPFKARLSIEEIYRVCPSLDRW